MLRIIWKQIWNQRNKSHKDQFSNLKHQNWCIPVISIKMPPMYLFLYLILYNYSSWIFIIFAFTNSVKWSSWKKVGIFVLWKCHVIKFSNKLLKTTIKSILFQILIIISNNRFSYEIFFFFHFRFLFISNFYLFLLLDVNFFKSKFLQFDLLILSFL